MSGPALVALLLSASTAFSQLVARPVYPPASAAWGITLRHFLESGYGREASLAPTLQPLRGVDLATADGRQLAAPFVLAMTERGLTPGLFSALSKKRRLAALNLAAATVEEGKLPSPEAIAARMSETAKALGTSVDDAPYMRVRKAADGGEVRRLASEIAGDLRSAPDDEKAREYVSALWEVSSAPPSYWAHRTAAHALSGELGRRRRGDKHKILVLRAMKALGDRTPYESIELGLIKSAMEYSRISFRDPVTREADFVADNIATLSPFPRVRKFASKQFAESAQWAADDDRRRDLERRAEALKGPPSPGYWPTWKPARPPTLWERFLSLVRLG
ncbi:MAG: hypothetical protein HY925_05535 [Elusimicrobia bacterium]|nr:hypothetical protein [Elusimicrobiota bacterium]